jgi:hypothetical protein
MASAFSLVGIVFALMVLVSMWIGVLALRKSGKHAGPRLMFFGCIALSLGLLVTVAAWVLPLSGPELATGFVLGLRLLVVLVPLGILLFMIGFTLHGLQVGRVYERIADLETIIEAQQEQLTQYEARA